MSGEKFTLSQEQIAELQAKVDALAATQSQRMSLYPISTLPDKHPLRLYAEARTALRAAGLSGEPSEMAQTLTPPIDARMQPY